MRMKPCDQCGTDTANPRFCSRRCSAIKTNSEAPRRKKGVGAKPRPLCPLCQLPMKDLRATRHDQCFWAGKRRDLILQWRDVGLPDEELVIGSGHNRRLKGKVRIGLMEYYGAECALCSWAEVNPYTKRVPLETDHINGDPSDNAFSNVRLLCPNCHALTSTYKGANRGKGRSVRCQPL